MQKEVDVNHALDKYCKSLVEQVNSCFNQVKNTHDPLAFITSSKGRWIFNNPLLKVDEKASLLHLATLQLDQQLHSVNDQYRCNHDNNMIYFYINNKQVISWKLDTNQVNIPIFNKRYQNQIDINNINAKITKNKNDLEEAQIVLNNPDALINHGLYVAYLKAAFAKKHYVAQCQAVIDNLANEQAKLQAELKNYLDLNQLLLNQTNEIAKLTRQIELITTGFPYHITYDKYLTNKQKDRTNTNEKQD